MILIKKSAPPEALVKLKQEAQAKGLSDKDAYDTLRNPLKKQVRDALMTEQGHLCAYCMRKIPDKRILHDDKDLSDVYIEHWQPISAERKGSDNRGLDYNNMFAVCSGNEKAPGSIGKHKRRHLTCDKRKGNAFLTLNPLDVHTLNQIYYSESGEMLSDDPQINEDINLRLNLNCSEDAVTLPQNRKSVLDEVQKAVLEQGDNLLQNCVNQLGIWESEADPKTPYIGIAIWWLKEIISRSCKKSHDIYEYRHRRGYGKAYNTGE